MKSIYKYIKVKNDNDKKKEKFALKTINQKLTSLSVGYVPVDPIMSIPFIKGPKHWLLPPPHVLEATPPAPSPRGASCPLLPPAAGGACSTALPRTG
jgi:hypothetical protein